VTRYGHVARDAQCRGDLLQQLLAVERFGQEPEDAALRCRDGVGDDRERSG
jgi:hypothetical protein